MVIKIKELTVIDLTKSGVDFYKTLDNLVPKNKFNLSKAKKILKEINSCNGHVFIAVIDNKTIVGTTTVLLERKFIRGGKLSSHIEDVSIRKGYEGKGIASQILEHCVTYAKKKKCYKIVLDCKKELIPFYNKFGFKDTEVGMKLYLK